MVKVKLVLGTYQTVPLQVSQSAPIAAVCAFLRVQEPDERIEGFKSMPAEEYPGFWVPRMVEDRKYMALGGPAWARRSAQLQVDQ